MSHEKKKVKRPKDKKVLTEIAQRAVESRRKNHPEWGEMKRLKEAEKKKKAETEPEKNGSKGNR